MFLHFDLLQKQSDTMICVEKLIHQIDVRMQ